MPSNLAIGAFVLGAVLLLISVVKGGFKLFGAEVSGSAGGAGRFIAFVAGVVLIVTGFLKESRTVPKPDNPSSVTPVDSPAPTRPEDGKSAAPQPSPNLPVRQPPASVSRSADEERAVRVEWRPALEELKAFVPMLSDQEKMALFNNLMSGQDVYAINVRITNTGNAPVAVSPAKIRLTYLGTAIPLGWREEEPFFQATELQPNHYTEGILTFQTAILIAGSVLAQSRLSYQDPRVQVSYAR
jgi:hypothetical protein